MKNTGMVRKVDVLGRIVIPKEIRELFKGSEDEAYEFFIDDDKIILRRYEPGCAFCGEYKDFIYFNGKNICKQCVELIGELF